MNRDQSRYVSLAAPLAQRGASRATVYAHNSRVPRISARRRVHIAVRVYSRASGLKRPAGDNKCHGEKGEEISNPHYRVAKKN